MYSGKIAVPPGGGGIVLFTINFIYFETVLNINLLKTGFCSQGIRIQMIVYFYQITKCKQK
jgi:hypothetical protein